MTNGKETVKHIINQSKAQIFLCQDNNYLKLLMSIWDECPTLKMCVVWNEP